MTSALFILIVLLQLSPQISYNFKTRRKNKRFHFPQYSKFEMQKIRISCTCSLVYKDVPIFLDVFSTHKLVYFKLFQNSVCAPSTLVLLDVFWNQEFTFNFTRTKNDIEARDY